MFANRNYKQGHFYPKNKKKYKGDLKKIFFRSGLEEKYFRWLDNSPSIIQWNSEEVIIPYAWPGDATKKHRYFVDIWVKSVGRDPKVVNTFIAEIKPYQQVIENLKLYKNINDADFIRFIAAINHDNTKKLKVMLEQINICALKPKRITKSFKEKLGTYTKNILKWNAAEKWARKNNTKFVILTERDL